MFYVITCVTDTAHTSSHIGSIWELYCLLYAYRRVFDLSLNCSCRRYSKHDNVDVFPHRNTSQSSQFLCISN